MSALESDGVAPLSEVREVVRSKVMGALFYGSMFLFLADGAVESLDKLQVEFERILLHALPWFPGTLACASGVGRFLGGSSCAWTC